MNKTPKTHNEAEDMKNKKPDCYDCIFRQSLIGSAHSSCAKINAKVVGDIYGISQGWFFWPINFDPTWLEECNGFKKNKL